MINSKAKAQPSDSQYSGELMEPSQQDLQQMQSSLQNQRRPFKTKRNQGVLLKRGAWTDNESRQYRNFIRRNLYIFEQSKLRRFSQIFIRMSKYLKSRTAAQCRSHHQKMMIKYNDIPTMLGLHLDDIESGQVVNNGNISGNRAQKIQFYTISVEQKNTIKIAIQQKYIRQWFGGEQ